MIIKIDHPKENLINFMRRVGYAFQRNEGDEQSFVRPLARAGYPRFHAYGKMDSGSIVVKIHLDQKRETYGQSTRHHGEYEDSTALETEVTRIKSLIT